MTDTPQIELKIGDNETGEIFNGDIPITWCVSEELLETLEYAGYDNPHILLATTQGSNIMYYELLPLSQLKSYVRFNRAGECNLHAFIIGGHVGESRKLKARYYKKTHGTYDFSLVDYYGEAYELVDLPDDCFAVMSTSVDIPTAAFAKEPNKKLKAFVNMWHEKKVRDECHFRQRMVFAFLIKIWAVALVYCVNFAFKLGVLLFLTLAGYSRKTDWSALVPHHCNEDDCHPRYIDMVDDQQFIVWKDDNKYGIQSITPLIFTPIIVILTFLLALVINHTSYAVFEDSIINTAKAMLTMGQFMLLFDIVYNLINKYPSNSKFGIKIENYFADNYDTTVHVFQLSLTFIMLGFVWFVGMGMITTTLLTIVLVLLAIYTSTHWYNNVHGTMNNIEAIKNAQCPCKEPEDVPKTLRLWVAETKNRICKPMQM